MTPSNDQIVRGSLRWRRPPSVDPRPAPRALPAAVFVTLLLAATASCDSPPEVEESTAVAAEEVTAAPGVAALDDGSDLGAAEAEPSGDETVSAPRGTIARPCGFSEDNHCGDGARAYWRNCNPILNQYVHVDISFWPDKYLCLRPGVHEIGSPCRVRGARCIYCDGCPASQPAHEDEQGAMSTSCTSRAGE
jgi:hypothetical protein